MTNTAEASRLQAQPGYTDATHNVNGFLKPADWNHDLPRSGVADIVGYQEAGKGDAHQAVVDWNRKHNRGTFGGRRTGNLISWNLDTFARITGEADVLESHGSAASMGVKFGVHPAKDIAWVGLTHKATGKRVLRINVHPEAQATKPEHVPGNRFTPTQNRWLDWAIGQYWLDVLTFTADQMSRNQDKDPGKPYWDAITLGGDFNADLTNQGEWYYPATLLPAVYGGDAHHGGLDHLIAAHGSDVETVKRWTVKCRSDHDISLVTRRFTAVDDFPAEA